MATTINKKNLRVTELDFDQIKENLKICLKIIWVKCFIRYNVTMEI